jgi:hypothetical protein
MATLSIVKDLQVIEQRVGRFDACQRLVLSSSPRSRVQNASITECSSQSRIEAIRPDCLARSVNA